MSEYIIIVMTTPLVKIIRKSLDHTSEFKTVHMSLRS